jgi:hypothetical protein
MTMDSDEAKPQAIPCFWHYDHDELRRAAAAVEGLKNGVGTINPRLPGWHNDLVQTVKWWLARGLAWYTRPSREFNASVSRAVEQIVCALEQLSMNMLSLDHLSLNMVALEGRLAQSEKRSAALAASIEEQFDLLREQVKALAGLQKTANPEASARSMETGWGRRAPESSGFYVDTGVGSDRTAYVIGLFGTGRHYINELMQQHIGRRAKYFRDTIRVHPGPTPMIYSGHATIKHISRAQAGPEIMGRILGAVRSGFADVIFVYRHPLDSLLTNWIWWRTHIREHRWISGISQVYKNTDRLCADLERNFLEFKGFAGGNPDFFAAEPGPRFLSFAEFVEETEIHLQSATLALRLEDFTIDPLKEFGKIAEVMSVDLDWSRLCIAPPRTKPYGYLAVKDKVPRFRSFINELNAETRSRIEKIGYDVTV